MPVMFRDLPALGLPNIRYERLLIEGEKGGGISGA